MGEDRLRKREGGREIIDFAGHETVPRTLVFLCDNRRPSECSVNPQQIAAGRKAEAEVGAHIWAFRRRASNCTPSLKALTQFRGYRKLCQTVKKSIGACSLKSPPPFLPGTTHVRRHSQLRDPPGQTWRIVGTKCGRGLRQRVYMW